MIWREYGVMPLHVENDAEARRLKHVPVSVPVFAPNPFHPPRFTSNITESSNSRPNTVSATKASE